jgi:hypothetical protein
MGNFRKIDGVIGFGVLCALVVGGLSLRIDQSIDNEIARILQDLPLNGVTGSPIVVRGGSMTVRTTFGSGGWVPHGNLTFCSDGVDTSYVELIGVTNSQYNVPTALANINADWTITINGRAHTDYKTNHSSAPSTNGIVITSQMKKSCGGGEGKSILLAAIIPASGTTYSSFYQDEASVHEDSTSSTVITAKRFLDTTGSCISPNTNNTADEDTCERASTITFAVPASTGTPYTYNCTDGECVIGIGKPK